MISPSAARTKYYKPDDRVESSIASYDAMPATYAARYSGIDMGDYPDIFVGMLPRSAGSVIDAGCGPVGIA